MLKIAGLTEVIFTCLECTSQVHIAVPDGIVPAPPACCSICDHMAGWGVDKVFA